MNNIKNYFSILSIALLIGLVSSCKSGGGTMDSKDALSSFLNGNEDIVTFGNADLKSILGKVDYKNLPKVGGLIDGELTTLEKVIDFDSPAYYAMQGPFEKDGSPAVTYAFFQIKDGEAFETELTKRGYDVIKKGDINIAEDEYYAFGYKNNLAILVKSNNEANYNELIAEAFKKVENDESGGKIDEILDQKGDVVLGMNVQSLYNTSSTDLTKLSKEKQDELQAMVKDSYIQTVVKFEDGAAIIETKNFFSAELQSRMFFKSEKNAPILAKLGDGSPRLGLSVNLDMKKMQSLINDYSPETMKELSKSMGPIAQTTLMFAGKEGLAALFNGQLGFVMLGDPGENGAMIPDFNAYLGVTKRGNNIASLIADFIPEEFAEVSISDEGMTVNTQSEFSVKSNVKGLNLPEGAENFGQSSISFFINLDGLDLDDFDLEKGQNLAKIVKYITFDYDENGGRLYIKAKKGQENVLKQAVDVLLEEFESEIGQMPI
ncbi:MAG: hypothetical protein COA33_013095 [Fluviicola sp.]|nr:hypothetical protein [Fluviicola sp.]